MLFANTRTSFQTVLLITQSFLLKNKLDSFRSYQLVEADRLVCMPAPGDRTKVGFDEIDKTLHAYMISQQHSKKQKSQNAFKKQ